jgi:hypothetical protein
MTRFVLVVTWNSMQRQDLRESRFPMPPDVLA